MRHTFVFRILQIIILIEFNSTAVITSPVFYGSIKTEVGDCINDNYR